MNGHSGPYVQYEQVKDDLYRVYNMLGGHAVLYLTEDYIKMCQKVTYHAGYVIEDYQDIGFAEIQRWFNVYTFDDPFFYQTSGYHGTVEALTSYPTEECFAFKCAREAGVKRVMYSSTSSGYGMNEPPNVETQDDDCLNPYSVSKVNGEKLCKMYTSLYGLETVCFRYFNVYGNRQPLKGQYAPVIGIFLRQLAAGEPLTIVGDGEQRRDFTHVDDVVNANIKAALADIDDKCFGQVYNVGTGLNHSINEIAAMISDNIIHIPPRPGEAMISLANNTRLRETFDWEPTVKLETYLVGMLNG